MPEYSGEGDVSVTASQNSKGEVEFWFSVSLPDKGELRLVMTLERAIGLSGQIVEAVVHGKVLAATHAAIHQVIPLDDADAVFDRVLKLMKADVPKEGGLDRG